MAEMRGAGVTEAWQRLLAHVRWSARRFESARTRDDATFQFAITLEEDTVDGGYVASVEDLPGCMSQGETPQEAVDNVIEALSEVLSARMAIQLDKDQGPGRKPPHRLQIAVPS